jgi:hypothetical protein
MDLAWKVSITKCCSIFTSPNRTVRYRLSLMCMSVCRKRFEFPASLLATRIPKSARLYSTTFMDLVTGIGYYLNCRPRCEEGSISTRCESCIPEGCGHFEVTVSHQVVTRVREGPSDDLVTNSDFKVTTALRCTSFTQSWDWTLWALGLQLRYDLYFMNYWNWFTLLPFQTSF